MCRVELAQRRHRWVAKRAIGLARHAGEICSRDRVADKRPNHFDGDLGIGLAGKAGDGFGVELRPGFRHVKSAVAGETRERHLDEVECRGFAPGRDVTHGS